MSCGHCPRLNGGRWNEIKACSAPRTWDSDIGDFLETKIVGGFEVSDDLLCRIMRASRENAYETWPIPLSPIGARLCQHSLSILYIIMSGHEYAMDMLRGQMSTCHNLQCVNSTVGRPETVRPLQIAHDAGESVPFMYAYNPVIAGPYRTAKYCNKVHNQRYCSSSTSS